MTKTAPLEAPLRRFLLGHKISDQYKIYFAYTGLFLTMLGRDTAKHILNNELTAIEVKSNDGRVKSVKEVLTNKNKYVVTLNYKLVNENIDNNGLIQTIPLYMVF